MSRVQNFEKYSVFKSKEMDENYLNILFNSCDDISFHTFYTKYTNNNESITKKSQNIYEKLYSVNNSIKNMCNQEYLNKENIYSKYDSVISLNKNSQKIWTDKPHNIKTRLKKHQLSTVYAMMYKELNNTIKITTSASHYRRRNIKHTSNINIGILSDNVGSGKTLSILTLIAMVPISIPFFDKKSVNVNKLCQKNINKLKFKRLVILLKNFVSQDVINIIFKYIISKIIYLNDPVNLICENSYTKIENISSNNILLPYKTYIPSNLIIVPHSLFYQWLKDITEHTNLKVYPIRTKRDKIDMELFMEYDVILCNANKYKIIAEYSNNYKWSRVIIDEADTINLPNSSHISYDFLWFITTTYERLDQHKNIGFIKNTFRELEYNITHSVYKSLKKALVIETENNVIEDSFTGNIPKPIYIKIECETPLWLETIKDSISKTVLTKLNAGDIDGAIKSLDSNTYTYDFETMNIFQYLFVRLKRQIETFNKRIKKISLQLRPSKFLSIKISRYKDHYIQFTKRRERYVNLKQDKEKKLKLLKTNILSNSLCLLCLNQIKSNSLNVKCCNSKFCKDCLHKHLSKYNKCPSCFLRITLNSIKTSFKTDLTILTKNYNTKILNLIKIIDNNPNGKFLIFSNYTFKKIINEFNINKISWKKLCGRPDVIRKIIKNFTNGNIKVLMLNAKHYGSGLNLQMTTDIIMFHQMDENTNTQIIGRAQRVGRTNTLRIHRLLYNHEL